MCIEVFIDVLQYIDVCVCVSLFVYWIHRHQGFYILETFEKTILCASISDVVSPVFLVRNMCFVQPRFIFSF